MTQHSAILTRSILADGIMQFGSLVSLPASNHLMFEGSVLFLARIPTVEFYVGNLLES